MDQECYAVIEGGNRVKKELLKLDFDCVLYMPKVPIHDGAIADVVSKLAGFFSSIGQGFTDGTARANAEMSAWDRALLASPQITIQSLEKDGLLNLKEANSHWIKHVEDCKEDSWNEYLKNNVQPQALR